MFCRSIGLHVRESDEGTRASGGSRWLSFICRQSRSSPASASWSPAAPFLRCSSVKTNRRTSLLFTSSYSKIQLIKAPLGNGSAGQNGKISANRLVQGCHLSSTHLSFKNVWTQGHGSFKKNKMMASAVRIIHTHDQNVPTRIVEEREKKETNLSSQRWRKPRARQRRPVFLGSYERWYLDEKAPNLAKKKMTTWTQGWIN